MHFDVPVGQPLPCFSRASPSRPEPTVRFPRVGHELTHVVVFGVVKGEVFEVCRNETHPSQATNEASHGFSVLVDEGPARATHSRLDREPVHRIFLEAVRCEQDHARPRQRSLFEKRQSNATSQGIAQQVFGQVSPAQFCQPQVDGLLQESGVEDGRRDEEDGTVLPFWWAMPIESMAVEGS